MSELAVAPKLCLDTGLAAVAAAVLAAVVIAGAAALPAVLAAASVAVHGYCGSVLLRAAISIEKR